jgi:hypothetical protein
MSYEVEVISTGSSGTPVIPSVMREERIVSPYEIRGPKPLIGQQDISKETVETKVPVPTEETVKLSPQLAALARREQKFRAQQQEYAKKEAALTAEREELAQLRAMKQKLAAKDYSGLDDLVDYNEYSQYQVNKLNGADPIQDELKRLNGKISEQEKLYEENVGRQFEAAVEERRIATQSLVNDSDKFPRIKKSKAHEAVVQHILDTWEHDSKELSVEQAAKEVEEVLLEKARQWASLLEEQKIEQAAAIPEKKSLPPLKPGLKTLTNQITSGDLKPYKSLHGLSDSERWAEARRRAEAKLQNR